MDTPKDLVNVILIPPITMPSLEDNRKESPCGQIHGNYQSLCSYRSADTAY